MVHQIKARSKLYGSDLPCLSVTMLWEGLDEKHGSVGVRALKANPAHRFLNQRLKELESGAV